MLVLFFQPHFPFSLTTARMAPRPQDAKLHMTRGRELESHSGMDALPSKVKLSGPNHACTLTIHHFFLEIHLLAEEPGVENMDGAVVVTQLRANECLPAEKPRHLAQAHKAPYVILVFCK